MTRLMSIIVGLVGLIALSIVQFIALVASMYALLFFAVLFYIGILEPIFDPAVVCAHDGNMWNGKTGMCIDKDGTEYKIKII